MGVGRAEQLARAGRSGQQATVGPPEACQDITDYCPVTIVHGRHRLDLALPTAMPISELMTQLLRLMIPAERPASRSMNRVSGDSAPSTAVHWKEPKHSPQQGFSRATC